MGLDWMLMRMRMSVEREEMWWGELMGSADGVVVRWVGEFTELSLRRRRREAGSGARRG